MHDPALQLIGAIFRTPAAARRALAEIRATASRPESGILDAVAVTRASDGALVLQEAADPPHDSGCRVSAVTGAVLGLLWSASARPEVAGLERLGTRLRSAGMPQGQLRGLATLLTPLTSAVVAIVAPAGAAEVVGAVVEDAWKLAVEDLPPSAVLALAAEPALIFAAQGGVALPLAIALEPHPAFAAYLPAPVAAPPIEVVLPVSAPPEITVVSVRTAPAMA
jgi:hypothetical protein